MSQLKKSDSIVEILTEQFPIHQTNRNYTEINQLHSKIMQKCRNRFNHATHIQSLIVNYPLETVDTKLETYNLQMTQLLKNAHEVEKRLDQIEDLMTRLEVLNDEVNSM